MEEKIIYMGEYEIIIRNHDDRLEVFVNDILGNEIENIIISDYEEDDDKINLN